MAYPLNEDGFSVKPKHLDKDNWFYEGRNGITIAYTAKGTLQSIVGIIEIPWSRLKPSIERYQKYQKRKPRR